MDMDRFCSEVHNALPANLSHPREFKGEHVFQEAFNFRVVFLDSGAWKCQGLVSIGQVLKWMVQRIADPPIRPPRPLEEDDGQCRGLFRERVMGDSSFEGPDSAV